MLSDQHRGIVCILKTKINFAIVHFCFYRSSSAQWKVRLFLSSDVAPLRKASFCPFSRWWLGSPYSWLPAENSFQLTIHIQSLKVNKNISLVWLVFVVIIVIFIL